LCANVEQKHHALAISASINNTVCERLRELNATRSMSQQRIRPWPGCCIVTESNAMQHVDGKTERAGEGVFLFTEYFSLQPVWTGQSPV